MTIHSFTSDKEYETTLTSRTCPDHYYRHHTCKHMRMIAEEVARTERFLQLREQYDVRAQAASRAAYVAVFDPCGVE